jgi:hypothetical protein
MTIGSLDNREEVAMDFISVLGVALGLLSAAALPYLLVESGWRWRWREVICGEAAANTGAVGVYRVEGTVPTYRREAPASIRLAAFTSLLFGQMFLPGLLLGAFGLLAGGIGLVSIPGLITAAKLYRSGLQLLRREPREAYFAARNAATWVLWLNGVVLLASLMIVVSPLRPSGEAGWSLLGVLNGYGLLSMLQALLVMHATAKHEDALFAPSQMVRIGSLLVRTDEAA